MAEQEQDDQLEHTYSSYEGIRDVALKTCQRRWTIGRSGERGSSISVLAVRHDDDDCVAILLWLILVKNQVIAITVVIFWVGWLVGWFYGKSTLVGYLMSNLIYTYISNILDLWRNNLYATIFTLAWAHFFFAHS